MVWCAELGISVQDFWSSTPREFNALVRGKYQHMERQGSWALASVQTSKPIKLKDFLGFEVLPLGSSEKGSFETRFEGMDEVAKAERSKTEFEEIKAIMGAKGEITAEDRSSFFAD
ncbi:hypothetical protein PQD69_gp021 [Carnobacterium phage cd4]|uniref:Uncharacterized protein n=1 Tax=Carnobacterium phage cd4 TaxID=2849246 RepID=A0AAE7SVB8_9CAUD|nr:hypothetical protein PQD69_gp021 [Carnobacterium phage cd4]QXP45380.1 hypothetical protein cd4_021 [Carnobacterium phage cd4]